jgi:hypothetical protein
LLPFIFLGILTACTKKNDGTTSSSPSPSTGAETKRKNVEIQRKTPDDWLVVEDTTFIPVIDDLSRKMLQARQAFLKKDNTTAAEDLRQSATLLSAESSGTSVGGRERIQAAARDLDNLANGVTGNKVSSVKQLDATFIRARNADIEQRWAVADETEWYPYVDEPNQHFKSAHDAFLRQDFKKAAEEMRKGEAFVKLEGIRATGDSKPALNSSGQELEKLAGDVSRGKVKDVKSLDNAFARANYALAFSARAKASESWARKEKSKAGYELKATANDIEQGASWTGGEVRSSVSTSVGEMREVGSKLIAGTSVDADDVGKAIETAGQEIELQGKKDISARH